MANNLKEFSTDSLILEVLNEPQGELDNVMFHGMGNKDLGL